MPAAIQDLVAGGVSGDQRLLNIIRPMRNTIGTICDPEHRMDVAAQPRNARTAHEPRRRKCAEGLHFPARPSEGRWPRLSRLHSAMRARRIFSTAIAPAPDRPSRCSSRAARTESFRFLDALKIAKLAVSLGGTETLASHPAAMTHLSVPDERKNALGITDNLVRVSIGIEDPDDLIADFAQALDAV
jgi:methionine-gamma-lyase